VLSVCDDPCDGEAWTHVSPFAESTVTLSAQTAACQEVAERLRDQHGLGEPDNRVPCGHCNKDAATVYSSQCVRVERKVAQTMAPLFAGCQTYQLADTVTNACLHFCRPSCGPCSTPKHLAIIVYPIPTWVPPDPRPALSPAGARGAKESKDKFKGPAKSSPGSGGGGESQDKSSPGSRGGGDAKGPAIRSSGSSAVGESKGNKSEGAAVSFPGPCSGKAKSPSSGGGEAKGKSQAPVTMSSASQVCSPSSIWFVLIRSCCSGTTTGSRAR